MKLWVAVGGVLTGEHGVGVEKRDFMGTTFSEIDLAQQERLKWVFDAEALLNPGKLLAGRRLRRYETLVTVFAYMTALQPWKGHKPVLDSKAI